MWSLSILNVKCVDDRCVLCNMSKKDITNRLNNSKLDDRGTLWIWNFGANTTPIEVIKEGAFGGTYIRDIYSGVNGKWYRNSWKEINELKDIDQKYYCSNYYDVSVNKYHAKCWNLTLNFRFNLNLILNLIFNI